MMLSHPNKAARTDAMLLKVGAYLVRDVISVASGFAYWMLNVDA